MLDPRFVLLAAALSMIGSVSYAALTLRGRVQPNRVSWFLWGAAPLIAFGAQVAHGVGMPALSTLAIGVGPMLVVLASLCSRGSYWSVSRFDMLCAAISVVALVFWFTLGDPVLAVLAALVADLVGGVPTIVKAWRRPDTERAIVYVFVAGNGVITLLSLRHWTVAAAAFPLYLVLLGVGLSLTVHLRGRAVVPEVETCELSRE
ncbi:hypothetical protein P0W64_20435 [Tsukamurella sp. 8F]|uniref:hypothetical protein n=1 Tax=unclassified Tsukamurella TaxID=2633480 RepID=UPI0023B9B201|nr:MULTISPECIES: hypothetical protein [unclassified Tsukamurella]MDF0528948.1 hypothetical protein [Tsukamurella sp. 8J]MDF0589152.1 hypothetical protein [Tsukamurella sp. 8F]